MKRIDILERIGTFPALLARVVADVPETLWRTRPADGSFALVEHIWHLGDLEREGFGERIDVIARERNYIDLPMALAFVAFEEARATNIASLSPLTATSWKRSGTQEHVGAVTVSSVLESILAHDIAHANEIAGLLMELELPLSDELTALAALGAGASSAPAA